tara:strand:- start:27 stop:329 length:303 start_codon:yes stop_codon:yes gene_type:complete
MRAYKLFRQRKNNSLGSLFINKRQVLQTNTWYQAEAHETKGYKFRPYWHSLPQPKASHLSEKNRVWYEIEIDDYQIIERPASQGGTWYLSERVKILRPVK